MQYFAEALQSDVSDIQQGTTAEGIHLGRDGRDGRSRPARFDRHRNRRATCFASIRSLPEGLDRLQMRIRYRGYSLDLHLTKQTLVVHCRDGGPEPIRLGFRDQEYAYTGGESRVFRLLDKPA